MAKEEASKTPKPVSVQSANAAPSPVVENNKPKRSILFYYVIPALAVFFLVANLGLFAYLQFMSYKQRNPPIAAIPTSPPRPSPTPTPTPTPYPLQQGKIKYTISYGKDHTGPKINSITINPFDPTTGTQQTFTIEASGTTPILSADLSLTTDKKTASYSMQKVSESGLTSIWEVTITTNDTHLYIYSPSVMVKTATEKEMQSLTLRAY